MLLLACGALTLHMCLCRRGSCTDEAYWRDRRDQATLLDAAGHLYILGGRLNSSAGSLQFNDVYRSSFSFNNLTNVGLACHISIPRCGAGLSCWPDIGGTVVSPRGVSCTYLQTCIAPGSGSTPASQLSSSSLPAGVCDYGGQWPNACQCKCGPGVEPYCTPCPGEGEQSGSGGSGMGAVGVIAIVVLVALLLVAAGVGAVWWKNRRGRVTYSLDALADERAASGSSSSSSGSSRWLPALGRSGTAAGSVDGLLGDDESSSYNWQSYGRDGGDGGSSQSLGIGLGSSRLGDSDGRWAS